MNVRTVYIAKLMSKTMVLSKLIEFFFCSKNRSLFSRFKHTSKAMFFNCLLQIVLLFIILIKIDCLES